MAKRYFLITFGCQMNKSDSEKIAGFFESKGYKPALKIERADLIIVNMCSVRQSAVDRVYGLSEKIKKLQTKKYRPGGRTGKLKTILTGCILKKDRKNFSKLFDQIIDINKYSDTPAHRSRISGLVPIMTGCNNFCAYCVVPSARGREISRPAEEITYEIKNLIKNNYKEIWLLGQNVNRYHSKLINFPRLLKLINKIPGNFWIRFTSSHPKDFSDELINVMTKCRKITPYLNLPVQAGDDKILKKMNRSYTIAQYKKIIEKVKKKIPGICLSTDVIVGFPSETKKQFENTAELFRKIKYDMAYISKYSPRSGTTAYRLKDNVSWKEKKRREKILTEILKKTALKNNKKYIGKTLKVLMFDNKTGKTETNKTVKILTQKNLTGRFIKVKITNASPWNLKGKYVK